jgi:hypothetical protein
MRVFFLPVDTPILTRLVQFLFISPPHKRVEGRALVWGSELTTKQHPEEGVLQIFLTRPNVKFWHLRGGGDGGGGNGEWWWCSPPSPLK